MAFRSPQLRDRAWLYDRYVTQRWSIAEIGEACYAEKTTIYSALAHHGIPLRKPQLSKADWSGALTREFLTERIRAGMTSRQIAREVGCHPSAVTRAKARHQLLVISDERAAKLRRLYIDEGLGSTTIAQRLGVQEDTVARWLRAAGIELRGPQGGVRKREAS